MRLATFAAASVLCLAAVPSLAAEQKAYTAAALKAAQTAGKPIIVDVAADWCTTCKAQKPIVQSILKQPKFKDLVLLHLDYDKQKSDMRALRVQERSTFVVFKGANEVGRSTGDTDKTSIQSLFDKAS